METEIHCTTSEHIDARNVDTENITEAEELI